MHGIHLQRTVTCHMHRMSPIGSLQSTSSLSIQGTYQASYVIPPTVARTGAEMECFAQRSTTWPWRGPTQW